MALLKQNEVSDLVHALIDSGLDTAANRGALFQFVPHAYVATIPAGAMPTAQLLRDIGTMSVQERLANGDIPLEIYLRNADLLLAGAVEQQKVVRAMLNRVLQRASGAPAVATAAMPEINEKIVHTDDTVTFDFMKEGVGAAAAVMKLRVPRYDGEQPRLSGGNPVVYLGTGWLLSNELALTNHHVINARNDGEPNAASKDFLLQAQGTKAQFDFDADLLAGTVVDVKAVEAWDPVLDYAVLRLSPSGRAPLRRAAAAVAAGSEPIPVNIIQHPGGRSKRYAIRNNLVSASEGTELRYFTDTEGGSSGSPVFNDRWEVVALHRASKYVEGVQFQGKTTAYVNVGTHLASILADLHHRYPGIAGELGA